MENGKSRERRGKKAREGSKWLEWAICEIVLSLIVDRMGISSTSH
jgi:hypothetical protein